MGVSCNVLLKHLETVGIELANMTKMEMYTGLTCNRGVFHPLTNVYKDIQRGLQEEQRDTNQTMGLFPAQAWGRTPS